MVSMTRRKPAKQHPLGPLLLAQPDDILILICSQFRIDDLLNLRLVHSRFRRLIVDYFPTIASAVARTTFPDCDLLLARYGKALTLQELKGMRIEQLASIAQDRHRFCDEAMQGRYGIPAEDPFGNYCRDRLALGWRFLASLSQIGRDVHRAHAKARRHPGTDFVANVIQPSRKVEILMQAEDAVLKKRLEFISTATREQVRAYRNLILVLSFMINTSLSNQGEEFVPWPFGPDEGVNARRYFRKGETWFTWYVLSQGPDIFWQQWWNLPPHEPRTMNYIRDHSVETYNKTPRQLADHQKVLATTLHYTIYSLKFDTRQDGPSGPGSPQYRLFNDWARYATIRQEKEAAGEPLAREVLNHVPFLINFRCTRDKIAYQELRERHARRMQASLVPR